MNLKSKGLEVRRLQRRLAELKCDPGRIDGEFGSRTREAVVEFQQRDGLKVDGIVGPRTRAKLAAL
jgi:peptidoglycan hydrolase-like protein with peptidoglycan-binding domain